MTNTLTDAYDVTDIANVPRGEYVRIMRGGKAGAKVYELVGYDRSAKAYRINDESDIGSDRLIKAGTLVAIGFTY